MRKVVVSFGELLWDLLPAGPELGGAPSNFAYRMHGLGNDAIIVSRVGDDELGHRAIDSLHANGLCTDFIQIDSAHPTGTVDVSVSASGEPQFHIRPSVAYDFIEFTPALAQLATRTDCICFGTLVQRSCAARAALASFLAAAPSARKVLDINLRPECYSTATVVWSLQHSDILKLNDREVMELAAILDIPRLDRELSADDQIAYPPQIIASRFGLEACVVTRGAQGALAFHFEDLRRGREHIHTTIVASSPGIPIAVRDTCGSGDAFAAGFMHKYLHGAPLQECTDFGNALGAAVAETRGGTTPLALSQIDAMLNRLKAVPRVLPPSSPTTPEN